MPDKNDKFDKDEEPKSYTSVSFLRILGIPIPGDSDSIEEVVEAMKQAGAKPWHPPVEVTEPEATEDDE